MNDVNEKSILADETELKVVGTRPVRPDGVDKVTGKATYGADFSLPGMLTGRIKRSPHAHARIISIDASKALALPGVKAVITGVDFPKVASKEEAGGEGATNSGHIAQNCMAREKVLYEGHAVAAVAGTSPEIADAALALIDVTYEPLPHVIDVEEAMAPDAPLLHDNLFTDGLDTKPVKPSNIAARIKLACGDAAAAMARASITVEGRYTTQPVHQGYIEPHACVASVSGDGQAQLYCSSQGAFLVRTLAAAITGMEQADIRVIPAEIGGGFGGKTTVYLEPLALVLSRKTGRPVKMVMNRGEVFRATGPTSGATMYVKFGATHEGKIIAAELELKYQAGAFPGSPVNPGAMTALACYDIADFAITGWDVVTNTPKVAAYRAPGAPISAFAVESAIDELARKLNIDPLELRIRNGARNGTKAPYGPTFENIGYMETLEAIKSHPHYSAPLGPNQGRGLAVGFWFNHGGASTAMIALNEDGSLNVATGSPDIGGSRASMAMMAAEVLGLTVAKVRPVVADTASIGYSEVTGGSRTTYATGMAVAEAAADLIAKMKARAALVWGIEPSQVGWQNGTAICLDQGKTHAPLTIAEIAAKAPLTGGPLSAEVALNAEGAGPGFAVHLCDIEVDQETGQSRIIRYTAAQDVGRAIHPSYVEGQIQGGAAQGIGWALNEEYIFDRNGKMDNPGFLDYRMPVASDLPMIEPIMIEVPNPRHPFGVKGVGEVPIVPPLGAVANAVRNATGHRFFALPLSPSRVHATLHGTE